ncbi:MAG: hypothetical protein AAGC60_03525 [Acidobacteriota bacterium]
MSESAAKIAPSNRVREESPTPTSVRYAFSAAFTPESREVDVVRLRFVSCAAESDPSPETCSWVEAPPNGQNEYVFGLQDSVGLFLMNTGPEVQLVSASVRFTNQRGNRNPYRSGGTQAEFSLDPSTEDALQSDWTRGLSPNQAWFLTGRFNEQRTDFEALLEQNGSYGKTLEFTVTYQGVEKPPYIHDPRWVVGTGHPVKE